MLFVDVDEQFFSLLMEGFKLVLKGDQIRLEHIQKLGIRQDFLLEVIELFLRFCNFAFEEVFLFKKWFLRVKSVRIDLLHQFFKQEIVCNDPGKLIENLLLSHVSANSVRTASGFSFVVVLSAVV